MSAPMSIRPVALFVALAVGLPALGGCGGGREDGYVGERLTDAERQARQAEQDAEAAAAEATAGLPDDDGD